MRLLSIEDFTSGTDMTSRSGEVRDSKEKGNRHQNRGARRAASGNLSLKDKVGYAVDRFTSLGMTRTQALGAVGSLMGESGKGLNTGAKNPKDPNGGSFGIAQWHSERRWSLEDKAKKAGVPATDFRLQVDHIVDELNGPEKGTLNAMKKSKSLADATKTWTNRFERPDQKYAHHKERQNRARYATQVLDGQVASAKVVDDSLTGATNVTGYVEEDQGPEAFRDPYVTKVDSRTGKRTKAAASQGIEEEGVLDQVGDKIGKELSNLASPKGIVDAVGKVAGLPSELSDVVGGLFGKKEAPKTFVDETGFPTAPEGKAKNAMGLLESPVTSAVRSMFGATTPGAQIGALAGGMIGGGPVGALIGGVIGQGINAMFNRMQADEATMYGDDGHRIQRWTNEGDDRFGGLGGTGIGTGGNGMEGGLW